MRAGQRSSNIRLYTGAETKGTFGSVQTGWTFLAAEWGGFVASFLSLRTYGAGEVPAGTREIEFGGYSAVDERMGLEVTDGPEAGSRWRVVSVDRSNPKATLARVEPFTGEFT